MKRILLFHPLLFSLYPILFLLAHNKGQLSYQIVLIPAIVTVVATPPRVGCTPLYF